MTHAIQGDWEERHGWHPQTPQIPPLHSSIFLLPKHLGWASREDAAPKGTRGFMCSKAEEAAKALEVLHGRCILKSCQRCFLLHILGDKRPVPCTPQPSLIPAHSSGFAPGVPSAGERQAAPSIVHFNSRRRPQGSSLVRLPLCPCIFTLQ